MLPPYVLIGLNLAIAVIGTLLAKERAKRVVVGLAIGIAAVSAWKEWSAQRTATAAAEARTRLTGEMLQRDHRVTTLMLIFDLNQVIENDAMPLEGVFPIPRLALDGRGGRMRLQLDLGDRFKSRVVVTGRGDAEYDVHIDEFLSYSIPRVGEVDAADADDYPFQFDQDFFAPSYAYVLRLPSGPPHLPQALSVPELLTRLGKDKVVGSIDVDAESGRDVTNALAALWREHVSIAFKAYVRDNAAANDLRGDRGVDAGDVDSPFNPHLYFPVTLVRNANSTSAARFDLKVSDHPRMFFEETAPF